MSTTFGSPMGPHGVASPRERMTPRARFYMGVVATRSSLLGLFCLFGPQLFNSVTYHGLMSAFQPIPGETTIRLWGIAWLVTALTAWYATFTGREGEARAALLMSIVSSACWAMGFTIAVMHGISTGPTGTIVWWALVLKDGSMLRQPLRNPFEPLVQRVLRQDRQDREDIEDGLPRRPRRWG